VVPSYLLKPVAVDLSNYKQALIDTGYYTADKLK
jgi:putative multiple sugar transport system substrate-binding protein